MLLGENGKVAGLIAERWKWRDGKRQRFRQMTNPKQSGKREGVPGN